MQFFKYWIFPDETKKYRNELLLCAKIIKTKNGFDRTITEILSVENMDCIIQIHIKGLNVPDIWNWIENFLVWNHFSFISIFSIYTWNSMAAHCSNSITLLVFFLLHIDPCQFFFLKQLPRTMLSYKNCSFSKHLII